MINEIHILIIDDDHNDCFIFKNFLKSDRYTNYKVVEAHSGKQALQLLSTNTFHCILLDHFLPDISGLDLADQIINIYDIPTIVITGQGDEMIATEFLKLGVQDYLTKTSIKSEILKKSILGAIEKAQMKKRIAEQEKEILRKNNELQSSNEYLKDFSHTVAHDLKNPLHLIETFLDLIQKNPEAKISDPEVQNLMGRCKKSSQRMSTLIDDLLSYAKSTQKTANIEILNLNHIIDDVIQDLTSKIKEKSATVRVGKLPAIRGNQSQFYRIFLNLISNALKFSKKDELPVIKISCNYKRDSRASSDKHQAQICQIFVEDNGIGFEQENLPHIFKAFQRLHADYEGSGIGLATVKKIIGHHYGSITAKSIPGHGATFIMTLPIRYQHDQILEKRKDTRSPCHYSQEIQTPNKPSGIEIHIQDKSLEGFGCKTHIKHELSVGDRIVMNGLNYIICWITSFEAKELHFGMIKMLTLEKHVEHLNPIIALTDDDPEYIFLLKNIIKRFNKDIELKSFQDGLDLTNYLFKHAPYDQDELDILPDIILLDINMPNKNGIEVMKEIQNHSDLKRIPVVAVSSVTNQDTINELYRLGVKAFINKGQIVKESEKMLTLLVQYWLDTLSRP